MLYLSPFSRLAEKLSGINAKKELADPMSLVKTNEEGYSPVSEASMTSASKSVKKRSIKKPSLKVIDEQEYAEEEKDLELQKIMEKRMAFFRKTSISK